ncbi:ankyrin repeat protein, partial [Tribonema minus]
IAALHWACKGGHTEVVAALLSANAYVNELDKSGCTPLSYCAAWNSKDVAQLLLSCGASVNKADTHGKTPLMWASHEGHLAMARLLLAHGADTEAQDAQGRTAADIAYAQGHHKVEQLLLKGQRYFGSSPQEKQVGEPRCAVALLRAVPPRSSR